MKTENIINASDTIVENHNKSIEQHLTIEQITSLKQQLLDLRAEILQEISLSNIRLSIPDQEIESYIAAAEQAMLTNKQTELLNQINYALQKIAQGNYGICEITLEPIPYKRLEILPYTTHKVISRTAE